VPGPGGIFGRGLLAAGLELGAVGVTCVASVSARGMGWRKQPVDSLITSCRRLESQQRLVAWGERKTAMKWLAIGSGRAPLALL
jgi:hypothetical protein